MHHESEEERETPAADRPPALPDVIRCVVAEEILRPFPPELLPLDLAVKLHPPLEIVHKLFEPDAPGGIVVNLQEYTGGHLFHLFLLLVWEDASPQPLQLGHVKGTGIVDIDGPEGLLECRDVECGRLAPSLVCTSPE